MKSHWTDWLKVSFVVVSIVFLCVLPMGCGSSGGYDEGGGGDDDGGDDDGGVVIATPAYLGISTNQTSVKTDNSDSATITATVLDENYASIEGANVAFKVKTEGDAASGGQLSSSVATSDADGKASVTFSAGFEKSNKTVTIEASVSGLEPVLIPIKITGTTVTLSTEQTELEIGGDDTTKLTITVKDYSDTDEGGTGIYGMPVILSADADGDGNDDLSLSASAGHSALTTDAQGNLKGTTNVNGVLEIDVKADAMVGDITVTVTAAGLEVTQVYTVGSIGEVFRILYPESDPYTLTIGDWVGVVVNVPEDKNVIFVTTLGYWNDIPGLVWTQASRDANNQAVAYFKSQEAGIATIQVFYEGQSEPKDTLTIAVSAPSDQSASISLQANAYVVGTSTTDVKNQLTLTAIVRNANDQVVGNAPVYFSIENPTGGGEYISPAIAFTNSSGVATTTFTSGSLATGSEGVTLKAAVMGKTGLEDTIKVIIGGTAGSVIIGTSTKVSAIEADTAYQLPMSVSVADANGNPVVCAEVTLNAWPSKYALGAWTVCSESRYNEGECGEVGALYADYWGVYLNEDANRNLILDAGEDFNQDGRLTPPNSSAGNIPILVEGEDYTDCLGEGNQPKAGTVVTDENGVAQFYLVYLKEYAPWVWDEITASTVVYGTEIQTTIEFWLPVSQEDYDNEELHNSPFNTSLDIGSISLQANPSTLPADGSSKSVITATVKDPYNQSVDDGKEVYFAISSGSGILSSSVAYTQDNQASIEYTSGESPGTTTILAWVETQTGEQIIASVNVSLTMAGTVNVEIGAEELVADGQSQASVIITATDRDDNPVADGTLVTFSTTAGSISPQTATTFGGTATATLTAGTKAGTATVRADANGIIGSAEIDFIAGDAASIEMTSSPNNMTADGVSESEISAVVKDRYGNPIDGANLIFSITSGSGKLSPISAETSEGVATVTYTASEDAGTVVIQAQATNNVTGSVNIVLITARVGDVTVEASPAEIVANGSSTAGVKATVQDIEGRPVPDGTTVSFSTTNGSITGTATTTQGIATATLTSPTSMGSATVTATAGGISGTTTVTFLGGPAASIVLTANPTMLDADGSSSSDITAEVWDAYGNPAADDQLVVFTATSGMGSLSSTSETTSGGKAQVSFTAGLNVGTATITAKVGTVIETIDIQLTALDIQSVTVNALDDSIRANGTDTTDIVAVVINTNGDPVENTPVEFETDLGALQSPTTVYTDADGIATISLTSSTIPGTATVTARVSPTLSGQVQVTFTAEVSMINLSAEYLNLTADGQSTSQITATVSDANGFPISGEDFLFSVQTQADYYGSVSPRTGATDSDGVVTTTYTAPDGMPVSGKDTVIVTYMDDPSLTAQREIFLIEEQIGQIDLNAVSNTLLADGESTTVLTATVTNLQGDPVEDVSVTFSFKSTSVPGAMFLWEGTKYTEVTIKTNNNGEASLNLVAGTQTGTCQIKATSGGVLGNEEVEFTAGLVGSVSVTSEFNEIDGDGVSATQIYAEVRDMNNNLISDGTSIKFTTTDGAFSNGMDTITATTTDGVAETTLTSSQVSDADQNVTVTASYKTTYSDSVTIIFKVDPEAGEPVSMTITLNPDAIQVDKEENPDSVLGDDETKITITVLDKYGQPYSDSTDNIRITLEDRPDVNVGLDLVYPGTYTETQITGSTVNGQINVYLKAGNQPGIANVNVAVLKDGDGNDLVTPLEQLSPDVTIEAGLPYSIRLLDPTDVIDNGSHSLSWIVSARVLDSQNNPVPDGTPIEFGYIDGIGCSGNDGAVNTGSADFSSVTMQSCSDIQDGDTLLFLESNNEGVFTIVDASNASLGAVTVDTVFGYYQNNIDFKIGYDKEENFICTTGITGGPEPGDPYDCSPPGTGDDGIAPSILTWSDTSILKPFYLFASYSPTVMDYLGDMDTPLYFPGIEPIDIDVTLSSSSVTAGNNETETVTAYYHDSASNPNNIQGEELKFTMSKTTDSGFNTVGTGVAYDNTDSAGKAYQTVVVSDCLKSQKQTQITVTDTKGFGYSSAPVTLTIEPNIGAGFTYELISTDSGTNTAIYRFADDSLEVPEDSIVKWTWDFGEGVNLDDGQHYWISEPAIGYEPYVPDVEFTCVSGNCDFVVRLIVENDNGCTADTTETINVVIP